MYVTVSTYRAKVGQEDAIIALYEDWQRNQRQGTKGYLSWELLRNINAPREFIAIAHFESQELAQAATNDLNQDDWYSRLMSLVEADPVWTNCTSEWQLR